MDEGFANFVGYTTLHEPSREICVPTNGTARVHIQNNRLILILYQFATDSLGHASMVNLNIKESRKIIKRVGRGEGKAK